MDQDRQLPPRASNRSCVAHRRADLPEKGLRSSQHVLARTTDVSASSPHEATQPITQASLQSTLSASTIFESWLPMDSEIVRKGNCNVKSVRRLQAGLQSFLSMRRIEARRKNASAFRLRFSQSLASLRQRLSHATRPQIR